MTHELINMISTKRNHIPYRAGRTLIAAVLTLAPIGVAAGQPAPVAGAARIATTPIAEFVTPEGLLVVRLESGRPAVTLGGSALPESRLRVEGDMLVVTNADGATLIRLNRSIFPSAAVQRETIIFPENRRVIGVVTNPAPADRLGALKLDRVDAALLIESVVPDLPADRAGLKPGDLVLRVNGASPATIELLRESLAKVGAQPVRLDIARGGSIETFEVTPVDEPIAAEFSFTSLPAAAPRAREREREHAERNIEIERRLQTAAIEALRTQAMSERLEKEMERLASRGALSEARRADLERAIREAAEAIRSIEMKFDFEMPEMPNVRILREGGQSVAIFSPGARGGGGPRTPSEQTPGASRFEQIESRIARLEQMLETILDAIVPAPRATEPTDNSKKTPGG